MNFQTKRSILCWNHARLNGLRCTFFLQPSLYFHLIFKLCAIFNWFLAFVVEIHFQITFDLLSHWNWNIAKNTSFGQIFFEQSHAIAHQCASHCTLQNQQHNSKWKYNSFFIFLYIDILNYEMKPQNVFKCTFLRIKWFI